MQISRRIVLLAVVFLSTFLGVADAERPSIVVQSTTSTQDTGLFEYLLPKFS